MNDPRLLRLANLYQVASAGLLALVMFAVSRERALPVLAGGVLMAANFYALRTLVTRTLKPGGLRALYAMGLVLKFFTVAGVMAALLVGLKLDPVGFMIGLCSLVVGVLAAMAHQLLFAKPVRMGT
jgi:small-conductance mechanosensitive channel